MDGAASRNSHTGTFDSADSTRAALCAEPTPMPAQATALPSSDSPISMPARIAA